MRRPLACALAPALSCFPLCACACACACASASVARSLDRTPPHLVFTRAIVDDRPVDVLERVGADDPALCLSGKWFDLPRSGQHYRYELRDAEGRVVNVGEAEIEATAATWYTWSCYQPTAADAPGTWTYALSLGDATLRGSIEVEPRPQVGVLGALTGESLAGLEVSALGLAAEPGLSPEMAALRGALARCREDASGEGLPAAIEFTITTEGALVDVRADGEGPLARCIEDALARARIAGGRAEPLQVRVPLGG